jgi:hypothetical protein
MDSKVSIITRLMAKYARHEELTDEERRMLEEWWQSSAENRELAELFADENWVKKALGQMDSVPRKEMWREINRQLDEIEVKAGTPSTAHRIPSARARTHFLSVAVAVVALGVIVCAYCILGGKTAIRTNKESTPPVIGAALGLARDSDATWTDVNGSIPLSAVPVGGVVSQAGSRILRKVDSFSLAYDVPAVLDTEMRAVLATDTAGLFKNCLAIGKNSSPYHVQMYDGNAVWLGGGARLRYTSNRRDAASPYSISGKGLFDIVKNMGRPMVIHLPNGRRIKVVGTRFFVNAEADSPASTVALFSGKLRLFSNGDSVRLRAGQEAIARADGVVVKAIADSSAMMAWTGNSLRFHFNNAEFETVLAQVATWYGLKIVNPARLKGTPITCDLPRASSPDPILQTLRLVENGFIQLRLDRNTIIVSDGTGAK